MIKGNELSCTLRHGENLNALLSEICQSEKDTCCMIPTRWHFGKGKTMETVNKSAGCQGFCKEGRGMDGAQRMFMAVKAHCTIP